ncbi:DNA-binding GntR family transcriptional regulator [Rhizobium paknamense]|uniref:DNA-binding GntR family transcriptional regulator n=2 Tax=Rhizobium paknamense TaxID=1206817 RepID=A0ABU0IA63_9HYPH|nr:GntR family transcriptional regulator [Rhizobium paknamense]MDQ0455113.1 DNA-binding GntR family transcriptional regulator [Rhizobium paknamense]
MSSKDDTITSRIARSLAERIVRGEMTPGARLAQDHIAEEFDVSQASVREAFRRLEAQGLVVSLPRRGVRVASFDLKQVREVAEMRAALEVLALKHAAPFLTPALLDEAEAATAACDAAENVEDWEAANRRFHRLIISTCDMPRLLAAIDDLHAVSARFLLAGWQSTWERRTDHDHRAILQALRRGDTVNACAVLERHVQLIGRVPSALNAGAAASRFAIVG